MLEVIENNIPPTDSGFFLYFDSKRKTFLSETGGDRFFPVFIDREFDRNTVKALLKWFYTKGSYRN